MTSCLILRSSTLNSTTRTTLWKHSVIYALEWIRQEFDITLCSFKKLLHHPAIKSILQSQWQILACRPIADFPSQETNWHQIPVWMHHWTGDGNRLMLRRHTTLSVLPMTPNARRESTTCLTGVHAIISSEHVSDLILRSLKLHHPRRL